MIRIRYVITLLLLTVALTVMGGELTWFDGKRPVSYSVAKRHSKVVDVALGMFGDDMLAVTGMRPERKRHGIIEIVEENRGNDGFSLTVRNGRIRIVGNSGRGAAYGILELSRLAGVSPWIWWGDVVPERKELLTIDAGFTMEHVPSVAFRGIFLNDEDWSLRPWAGRMQGNKAAEAGADKSTAICAPAYRKIFELLLRLRANTLWPAMHEGTVAFFQTEGARLMADSCGIVIGTSHCEPILRNNVGEWDVSERGRFNYISNGEAVRQYWQERLDEVSEGTGEYLFTIGMRGIHDGSMEGVSTLQEKTEALQRVIDDQRKMLEARFPDSRQVFVPYKEVLQIYENGLRVPDDVMLMWCDDNYGYLTRLSDDVQQRRSGGAGVYYHLSYWGRPHDYLWLTTTQPGLICEEMRLAYDHQARGEWIANVHDPKVAAYDLELFLDMAWDINSVGASSVEKHLKAWLCRQYGERVGERIFPAMREFYRLCAIRKPEFMGWTQVELDKKKYNRGLSPVTEVGMTAAEAGEYLGAYRKIAGIVRDNMNGVRHELRDSYFAHVIYPVCAASAMAHKILSQNKAESDRAYQEIQQLTRQYNELAGGKWKGLMDAAPRRLPVFGNVHARLKADTTQTVVLVSKAACDYTHASDGAKVTEMLGHSMRAVQLPKGGRLTYEFSMTQDKAVVLTTALIPTQPNDTGDLRYSVSIDGGKPVVFSLKEPYRSERWKLNVLRGQAVRELPLELSAGRHTLVIEALDDHIVVDEWRIEGNE